MSSEQEQQDSGLPLRTTKRAYSTPILRTFGDWYALTLNGGVIVAADASLNTKTGR